MPIEALIIIIIIGLVSIYIFYLVSIYVKLENRRSRILGKFTEIDNQITNKLELVKELSTIVESKEIEKARIKLLNSVCVNDKIKQNKILDSLIVDIDDEDKKIKKVIKSINKINDKIEYSKEFYNESLYEYNMILNTKSGKIMKKIFKYCEYNMF